MWFHLCKIVYIYVYVCKNVNKDQNVNSTYLLVEGYEVVFTFFFLFVILFECFILSTVSQVLHK